MFAGAEATSRQATSFCPSGECWTSEFGDIGDMVADVLDGLASNGLDNNGSVESQVNERVRELCARFPIYQG